MNFIVEFIIGFSLVLWSIIYSIIAPFFPKKYISKKVRNQVVLVTGGASGFGRLFAKKFALDHGAIVVIWDINKAGLDETTKIVKNGGGKCFPYVVDISSRDAIYAAAAKVQAEVGKVDILINNAGIPGGRGVLTETDDVTEKIFKVNLMSHFWATRAFLPAMISTGSGHIVTISSAAGLVGVPKLASYCATKFGALGFHESLTLELKLKYPEAKIETTAICPYFCRTGIIAGNEDRIFSNAFLPIRDAEPVVDEMMDAILTNENYLIPSFGVRILNLIKSNLPSQVLTAIQNLILLCFKPTSAQPLEKKSS